MKKLAIFTSLLVGSLAWAGGFEFPDNGTEALGRGGAFTAKADDPTAIEYNIAGLAQQRGTRVLLDANLVINSYSFQRSGNYPTEDVPAGTAPKPYAGSAFPSVKTSGVFFAPFFGVTTDFGKLDRWTFAIGAYGPSSVGNRDYGLTVKGTGGGDLPAPSRYDLVHANLLIIFPTLAAAYRVTRWLDIGVALQLVVSTFDLENASFVDLGSNLCHNTEYQPCDATTHVTTNGVTATAALGLMFHPTRSLDIGLNLRGPVDVNTSGKVTTPGPDANPLPSTGTAEFHSHLPWVLRAGLRYKFLKNRFEAGDVEIDGTYEAWKLAEGKGDSLSIPNLGIFNDINVNVQHNYQDTVSVRIGGAYNLRLPRGILTFRLGAYYDSAATKKKDTRLDFDTMDKWAGTAGLGYKIRGVSINLAYAYIFEPSRDVKNGDLQSLNGINGSTTSSFGALPVVNNGVYKAENQILSLGITLAFDEILKKNRVLAQDYE